MSQKRIIIVGASSGIGRIMAEMYLEKGNIVGVTARRENLLNELREKYPNKVFVCCFDVMGNENEEKIKQLIDQLGGLDLLIYNSGYGEPSKDLKWEIEQTTTKTNVSGLVQIVSMAFNYFANKGSGQIAITSSIAAIRGNSWAPSYSASKAFMSNYAEGLNIKANRLEKDIVITDIKPGFIDTKMVKGKGRFWIASPQKAADQIINAIEKKKRVAYITRRWWLIAQIMKLLPYNIYKRIV